MLSFQSVALEGSWKLGGVVAIRSPEAPLFLTGFSWGPEGMLQDNKTAFLVWNLADFTGVEYSLLHQGNDRTTFLIITLAVLAFMSLGSLLICPARQLYVGNRVGL